MSNYLYLLINILVISGPLLVMLSDKKRRLNFVPMVSKFLQSLLPVAITFIVWDIYAVEVGHWSFNPDYILGHKFIGLALEEFLFFVTVPFALVFTYFVTKLNQDKFESQLPLFAAFAVAIISLFAGVFLFAGYTQLVLVALAITIWFVLIFCPSLFLSKRYFLFILIQFGLFLLVNTALTALPVITYAESAIIGIRVGSIPIEDFVYSFCLATNTILVFERLFPGEHDILTAAQLDI